MKKKASKQTGKQAGNEVQEVIAMSFEEFTRDTVRRAAWAIMVEEVEALCGPRYRPALGGQYRRAGTEKGVLRHADRREAIRRPRVRSTTSAKPTAMKNSTTSRMVLTSSTTSPKMKTIAPGSPRCSEGCMRRSRRWEMERGDGSQQRPGTNCG